MSIRYKIEPEKIALGKHGVAEAIGFIEVTFFRTCLMLSDQSKPQIQYSATGDVGCSAHSVAPTCIQYTHPHRQDN
jgi:hypothetical protein